MTQYDTIKQQLRADPKTWLVTGVAGFIGSNLLETLLKLDQTVVGLDNFSTGYQHNLDEVQSLVSEEQWARFRFSEGDICDLKTCHAALVGVDYVLHQAALGSVPRSLEDPIRTNMNNVNGILNMLVASRDAKVASFTYAASSSTYGDHPGLPKVEENIGNPLSPYAVTKLVSELYSDVFARSYGFKSIGLRYFNVFGRRQDPNGAYAAVIPKWIAAMLAGETISIYGDGKTSRDFCYIDNAVQANLLAATASDGEKNEVYNVAVGDRTSLLELIDLSRSALASQGVELEFQEPVHQDFRAGDVRHSQADISKISERLGYLPSFDVRQGIKEATHWYVRQFADGNI